MNLTDIAKKAGVSRSTVSRVINNSPRVHEKTRQRVQAIIQAEKFQPNPAARALVTRRTDIVGVVIPTNENIFFTDNDYFTRILAGASQVIRERDYGLLLWVGQLTDLDDRLMQRITNNRQMDGMIVASLTHEDLLFERLLSIKSPVVLIDRPLKYDDQVNYVSIDNVHAAEKIVNHLIDLGYRRIGHISGTLGLSDAQDRTIGYQNALRQAGLPIDPTLTVGALFKYESGYEAAKVLLPHKPDAIFAATDTIALGVLQAAREMGIDVPAELAVVGFDDIDVATRAIPPLTTVRQPVMEKGVAAAKLLIDLIQGRVQAPQRIILDTELVIRESCGARLTDPQSRKLA